MNVHSRVCSPLVVHVVYSLGIGGLENGLVNLINHMPADRYRHTIVCLTRAAEFRNRIKRGDVSIVELNKSKGQDLGIHRRFWQVLQNVKPDIIHTRNLATLEFQLTAALAGVRGRVHGEHGRDIYDLDGTAFKYNLLRKAMRGCVSQYIAVSRDLAKWLAGTVKVPPRRIKQIYNGVDTTRFSPRKGVTKACFPEGFASKQSFVIGTVGRMEPVKDQLTLVKAFLKLLESSQTARSRLRLVMIGNGSLYEQARQLLNQRHAESLAWLPGEREDVPQFLQAMDLFVLPSLREGISNTILEAMATGLPVIATNVGGNAELVEAGQTGALVPHSSPETLAQAIASYFEDPSRLADHGRKARETVVRRFSMQAMVDGYLATYDLLLNSGTKRRADSDWAR